LYLYEIKIQIDINQNGVEKYAGKSQIFQNDFLIYCFDRAAHSFWAGSDLAQKRKFGPISYKAGLSPAAWAGLMFQPDRTKGWLLCV
jgi:hypothetical protein